MAKLKNYDRYLQKLLNFSKALKIKVIYKEVDGEAAYLPSKRQIKIDPNLSESVELACFLHELGHLLDDTLSTKSIAKAISRAYGTFYKNKASKFQKEIVIDSEVRAWIYGRAVAKILGIKLGTWYDKEQKSAVKSYRKI